MELNREIQDRISEIKNKTGSNDKEYLILQLKDGESIFVFDNKSTPQDNWHQLQKGEDYIFTVKEGNRIGSNVLVHFEKIGFII